MYTPAPRLPPPPPPSLDSQSFMARVTKKKYSVFCFMILSKKRRGKGLGGKSETATDPEKDF